MTAAAATSRIIIGLQTGTLSNGPEKGRIAAGLWPVGMQNVCGHFPTTRVGRVQDVTAIDDGYDTYTSLPTLLIVFGSTHTHTHARITRRNIVFEVSLVGQSGKH